MNVREILEEIPKRYPDHELVVPPPSEASSDWFRIKTSNGWMLSCSYSRTSLASGRLSHFWGDLKECDTVEVAIFNAENEWFIAEGMVSITGHEDGTIEGVFDWVDSDKLWSIVDYIQLQ